jgi:hypothetical protein
MSKENQCNDKENTAIAMTVDGSSPKLHKAAPIRGSQDGNSSKPTSNGSK